MIRQGFAWWPFEKAGPGLLEQAARLGYRGIDFPPPELWNSAAEAGLEIVTIDGHWPIEVGFNNPAQHASLDQQVRKALDDAVRIGASFVAIASGDRLADARDGRGPFIDAVGPLAELASSAGKTLLLEPLNTIIDHPGHECDTTAWAIEVIEQVRSPGLALLLDLYHSHLMGEDMRTTIHTARDSIRHVHAASDLKRGTPSATDGIDWSRAIDNLNAIGYEGYLVQEFVPSVDPWGELAEVHAWFDRLLGGAAATW